MRSKYSMLLTAVRPAMDRMQLVVETAERTGAAIHIPTMKAAIAELRDVMQTQLLLEANERLAEVAMAEFERGSTK